MNFIFFLKLIIITIIFFNVIGDATNLTGVDNILRIELDIFSGRENPFWILTSNESQVFMEKVLSLPKGDKNESIDSGLGYRGFIITGDLLKEKCFEEIRVFKGAANIRAKDYLINLSDSGRGLELWLIKTARTRIDEELYESVYQEARK